MTRTKSIQEKEEVVEGKRYREPLKTKICKYSSFVPLQIGRIIAKLVTIIEGEEYTCVDAEHDTYRHKCNVWGSYLAEVRDEVLIIKKGNEKKAHYQDFYEKVSVVDRIIKEGDSFILARSENVFTSNSISLYRFAIDVLISSVNYQRFTYVKDFVDLVINYRLKNNVDEITDDELLNLLREYVINNRTMIEENYKKRDIERVRKYKEFLREEKRKRDMEIDNILSLIKKQ